jgi:hypothetical protein
MGAPVHCIGSQRCLRLVAWLSSVLCVVFSPGSRWTLLPGSCRGPCVQGRRPVMCPAIQEETP